MINVMCMQLAQMVMDHIHVNVIMVMLAMASLVQVILNSVAQLSMFFANRVESY